MNAQHVKQYKHFAIFVCLVSLFVRFPTECVFFFQTTYMVINTHVYTFSGLKAKIKTPCNVHALYEFIRLNEIHSVSIK